MPRPPRYLPYPGCLVEITAYTIQGRKLLRPDPEVTDAILGILGKGLQHFPETHLVGYQYLSNHPHILSAPESQEVLSRFMWFIQTNTSVKVGTHIRSWPGPFWHRRYDAMPVLDEGASVARLRYLLENSVKENLVETIEEWPGANCVHTLLTGEPNVGIWHDHTAESAARRRPGGDAVDPRRFDENVVVPLAPLPCWAHLPREEQSHRVRLLLDDIRDEHAARRARERVTVLGVEGVLAADPYEPSELGRPPRLKDKDHEEPLLCHASSQRLRDIYREIFVALVDAYQAASRAFRAGDWEVVFPEGTFRPSGGFVHWTGESSSRSLEWIESLSPA